MQASRKTFSLLHIGHVVIFFMVFLS